MLEIPGHITLLFILTTLGAYLLFICAFVFSGNDLVRRRANAVAILLLLWLIFQSTLSLNAWYMDRMAMPPHLAFPLIVSIVFFTLAFALPKGRKLVDALSLKTLLWLHVVRIPVELCLWWLAQNKQVPWSMTFEGYNMDIIFGLSAPVVAFFYSRKKIPARLFLVWNILGLVSVMAVLVRGIGAVPSPIQAWDFRQPNFAVMHFPFIWLPAFIVPAVVLAHLVALRRWKEKA